MNDGGARHVEPRIHGPGTVLVLGARAPVALDLARRFAAQGWRVLGGDSAPCRVTGWSRAVAHMLRLPSARRHTSDYATALGDAIARHEVDLVVPTCEETFYVARVRAHLPDDVRICAADFETLARLHGKWEFLSLAADAGADVPASAVVDTPVQACEWAAGRAVVLKPEYSRFGAHVQLHPQGLGGGTGRFDAPGRWVVQELCEGQELSSYAIADQGQLLAHACYRLGHRLRNGSGYYFEPVHRPALRAFAERFVACTGHTGQIAFDWIEQADGRCRVLECNPRATSGVHLFAMDAALPAALAGEAVACIEPAPQRRMLAAVMGSAGVWSALRTGRLRAWRQDWRTARDVVGAPGDRRPLAGALADLAVHAARARRDGHALRHALTHDIEWNGEPIRCDPA